MPWPVFFFGRTEASAGEHDLLGRFEMAAWYSHVVQTREPPGCIYMNLYTKTEEITCMKGDVQDLCVFFFLSISLLCA